MIIVMLVINYLINKAILSQVLWGEIFKFYIFKIKNRKNIYEFLMHIATSIRFYNNNNNLSSHPHFLPALGMCVRLFVVTQILVRLNQGQNLIYFIKLLCAIKFKWIEMYSEKCNNSNCLNSLILVSLSFVQILAAKYHYNSISL